MTIDEHICRTHQLCETALVDPELRRVEDALSRAGVTEAMQEEALRASANAQVPAPSLLVWHELVQAAGIQEGRHPLERRLLLRQVPKALSRLAEVPVDESVMHLFCKEFLLIADPLPRALPQFSMTAYPFRAMAKLVLLERFPAGQHQWEVSGFPRSWFPKIPMRLLPTTLRFLFRSVGGLQPWFVSHLTPTGPGAPILIEREFLKAFYRMALAIEKQPRISAIMATSWLHSPETHRVSPHLAFMNRPFLEAGGIVTDLGPAKPDDGFFIGSKARSDLYEAGLYKPTTGVAICSRNQAIAWAKSHSEMAKTVAAK